MKRLIIIAVVALVSAFTPFFWLVVGFLIIYAGFVFVHDDKTAFMVLLGLFVLGCLRFVVLEEFKEKTLLDTQVLRDISFADDSKSVHYKVGMTETTFSHVFSDNEEYFKNKATYLQRFLPDRKDTYQENCHVNTYKETFGYIYVLDKPKQILECY